VSYVSRTRSRLRKILVPTPGPSFRGLKKAINRVLALDYAISIFNSRLPFFGEGDIPLAITKKKLLTKVCYVDLQKALLSRDTTEVNVLHRMLQLLHTTGSGHSMMDTTDLFSYNLLMHLNHVVSQISTPGIAEPVRVLTEIFFFMDSCASVFDDSIRTTVYMSINEAWFSDMLMSRNNLSVYQFMVEWINSLYSLEYDDFHQTAQCFFEFLSALREKDVFLASFVASSEKRFLRFLCDFRKDELVALHLENRLENHHLVYRFKTMIEDIRKSWIMFHDKGCLLSASIWSSPTACESPDTLHPALKELVDLYEVSYTSTYEGRFIRWDIFHTMASFQLTKSTEVILPLLALNMVCIIDELSPGCHSDQVKAKAKTTTDCEAATTFWLEYLSRHGLLTIVAGGGIELCRDAHKGEQTVVLPVPSSRRYYRFIGASSTPVFRSESEAKVSMAVVIEERPEVVQAAVVLAMKRLGVGFEVPVEELFEKVKPSVTLFELTRAMLDEQIAILIKKDYLEHGAKEGTVVYVP
jgi:hypothetical protein